MGISRILIVLAAFVLGTSCFNEPDCIVTASTAIKIDFKQTKINPTTFIRATVDSLVFFTTVFVTGIDTAYIKNRQLSSLTLPIDPHTKEIKFVFNIKSSNGAFTRKDSMSFNYASESRVIAPKCGAYTYFLDLKVKSASYDSTKYRLVSNRLLKNTTNVQVFY